MAWAINSFLQPKYYMNTKFFNFILPKGNRNKIYLVLFQTWFTGLVVSLQYSNRIFHSFPDKSLQNSYNSRSWFLVFNAEAQRSVKTSGFQSFSERCPKNSLTILCSVFVIFNASPLIAWPHLWRWKDSLLIYPRTATDMDGTLHTDLWKSETSSCPWFARLNPKKF